MKISVVTVVFNNRKYVEDCIKSVLGQSYGNLEYVIVDGGSTDGTLDVIRKYEHRISKWVSEPDGGIYDAMNKGIKMSTGDIVGLLNSDDSYADAEVIKKVAEAFNTNAVESVYGDLVYVGKNNGRVVRHWRAGEYRESLIRRGWMPPHPAFFVRRENYEKYGYFNTDFRISADYEIILRFLGKERITTRYIPSVLVKMRTGGNSNNLKNMIRKSREDYRALKINGFTGCGLALLYKNLSKIPQFFTR